MDNYIFTSKPKNIIFTIIAAIGTLVHLSLFCKVFMWRGFSVFAARSFVEMLPFVLILIYMLRIKREYAAKRFIFPIAFAILLVYSVYSIRLCFDSYTFTSLNGLTRLFWSSSIRLIMILGSIFCFIGSLNGFSNVGLLRCGVILYAATTLILGAFYRELTFWIGTNTYYAPSVYFGELSKGIATLIFYISIFILTLNKKEKTKDGQ